MKYKLVQSLALPNSALSINSEGIAVIDLNADGVKDVVITHSGDPKQPVKSNDPPITVMFGQKDGTFTLADTTTLPPTGWVNDFVFTDSNGNGLPEIVAVDHGREISFDPKYWARMPVYEYDPIAKKFKDLTGLTVGDTVNFYHNAANTADINQDGLNDFIVATMGYGNFRIFTGDPSSIIVDSTAAMLGKRYQEITKWNSSSYIGPGAAGAIDIGGDGDYDLVILPYSDAFTQNQSFGQIFEFQAGKMIDDRMFNVRKSPVNLPADWGYSLFRVEDINTDGLQDIVAFAENPNDQGGGTAVFVTMLQNKSGSFDVSPAFPAESLVTERKGDPFVGRVWQDYKFSLEDLDGDGDLDLFWGNWFGGAPKYFKDGIFLNDGTGHFFRETTAGNEIASQVTWAGNGGARTYMSDLNQDGIGDFLIFDQNWANGSSLTTLNVFYSQNNSTKNSNKVVIGGLSSEYSISVGSLNVQIKDKLMYDGVVQAPLNSRVVFQDKTVALDINGTAGQAYRIYQAAFNRTPDNGGLKYWIGIMDSGVSLSTVSSGFIGSAEFQKLYGTNPTNEHFVTKLYDNVLHRTPDSGGYKYWVDLLNKGGIDKINALVNFSESNENQAGVIGVIQNGIDLFS